MRCLYQPMKCLILQLAQGREAQHLENQGITVFMSTFTSASDIEEHIESATVTKCDANQNPDRLVKLDQLVCWK
ncbi:unnamed protein product [Callosobruchus maculatus]|uniref:Uncharacterized protein n=1 Tax=Callosobruchus maculatus TaxID=64391 RepID=A0A653CYE0_CALMS|nr:unnamed protein product [Callosobruchus maculatus]